MPDNRRRKEDTYKQSCRSKARYTLHFAVRTSKTPATPTCSFPSPVRGRVYTVKIPSSLPDINPNRLALPRYFRRVEPLVDICMYTPRGVSYFFTIRSVTYHRHLQAKKSASPTCTRTCVCVERQHRPAITPSMGDCKGSPNVLHYYYTMVPTVFRRDVPAPATILLVSLTHCRILPS